MERDKMEKRIRDLKENRKKGINKGERGKNSNSKIKLQKKKRKEEGEKKKRYNKWHQRKRRGSKVWDRKCLRK